MFETLGCINDLLDLVLFERVGSAEGFAEIVERSIAEVGIDFPAIRALSIGQIAAP